jgi:hypothetical protein
VLYLGIKIALRDILKGVEKLKLEEEEKKMRKRILLLVSIAAFAIGVSIFAAPSTSHAIVINNVTVTVGNLTRCITGCGAGNDIWASAAGTNVTATGAIQKLVLTQTAGFNWDSSEGIGGANPNCGSPTPCTTTLNINGIAIVLSGPQANVLANNNADPGSTAHNEASNWNQAVFNSGVPGGLIVWFGYADNAHTDACADTTGTVAGNCLPDNPWQGSANTAFIGAAGGTAGVAGGCTRPGVAPCFDAGAIRIEVNGTAPEPSTMFLLGVGLVGLAAWGRKRQNTPKK